MSWQGPVVGGVDINFFRLFRGTNCTEIYRPPMEKKGGHSSPGWAGAPPESVILSYNIPSGMGRMGWVKGPGALLIRSRANEQEDKIQAGQIHGEAIFLVGGKTGTVSCRRLAGMRKSLLPFLNEHFWLLMLKSVTVARSVAWLQ
jgi:hypothetical protein